MESQLFPGTKDSVVDSSHRNSRFRQFFKNPRTPIIDGIFCTTCVPSTVDIDEKRCLFVHLCFGINEVKPVSLLFRILSVFNIQFTFEAELLEKCICTLVIRS